MVQCPAYHGIARECCQWCARGAAGERVTGGSPGVACTRGSGEDRPLPTVGCAAAVAPPNQEKEKKKKEKEKGKEIEEGKKTKEKRKKKYL